MQTEKVKLCRGIEFLDGVGLGTLLEANRQAFSRTKGLGAAKYIQIQAVLEMGCRYLAARLVRGGALTDPQATRAYPRSQLRGYAQGVFACLFLDQRHQVISVDEVFHGTLDGASVHPREVVKRALFQTRRP